MKSIILDIRGPQGNAYCVMGNVEQAMKAQGKTAEEIQAVMDDMMNSDYDHLISVARDHIGIIGA